MAEATDIKSAPKTRARKAAPRKTAAATVTKQKAVAAKPATRRKRTVKAAEPSFTESIDLARAAVTSATATAKAKVKGATENAKATVRKKTGTTSDWKAQTEQVKAQATKVARDAAGTAKAKTGTAMQGLAKLISETAQTVDTKLGPQYGDYARQAASAVANAAKSLDEKDVDQLFGDARDFVRKSPAVAIGAAAIAGYVLMRLAKGSSDDS